MNIPKKTELIAVINSLLKLAKSTDADSRDLIMIHHDNCTRILKENKTISMKYFNFLKELNKLYE